MQFTTERLPSPTDDFHIDAVSRRGFK